MPDCQRIEKLAEILAFNMHSNLSSKDLAALHHLYLLLAEGVPVSIEGLSAKSRQSPDDITNLLDHLPDIEFDGHGNIIGAGLTLRPTPHRLTINNRTVYVWCALDALLFPIIVRQTVQVESTCAATGGPVKIKVTPRAVEHIKPTKTVVSIPVPENSANIRCSFCSYVNFFGSDEMASQWLSEHPGATALSVIDAYRVSQLLAASFFQ